MTTTRSRFTHTNVKKNNTISCSSAMTTRSKISDNSEAFPGHFRCRRSQSFLHIATGRHVPHVVNPPMRNRSKLGSFATLPLRSPSRRNVQSSSSSSPKNAIWGRVRNAMRPTRTRPCPDFASDWDSIEHSLDSMEAFLKVVTASPEARTLAQKELSKTLQTFPRRSSLG